MQQNSTIVLLCCRMPMPLHPLVTPDAKPARRVAIEIHGLILALHYEARFLKHSDSIGHANQGFNHILARYAASSVTISVSTKE
jgi:hypothetical protein